MGASRPKRPMHTSESAVTAVAHSLRVQDVDMLCAPRVLEFDMQWRNEMPCRAAEEGRGVIAVRKAAERKGVGASPRTSYRRGACCAPHAWCSVLVVCSRFGEKIACVNFRTSGVSFSRCACCFVSFIRPANGEGKPSRNAALRARTRRRASTAFRFLPSLLHPVAGSR